MRKKNSQDLVCAQVPKRLGDMEPAGKTPECTGVGALVLGANGRPLILLEDGQAKPRADCSRPPSSTRRTETREGRRREARRGGRRCGRSPSGRPQAAGARPCPGAAPQIRAAK